MSYRKISLSSDAHKKIEKAFGCSWRTVHNALHYVDGDEETGTDTGRRIRKMAMAMGGEILVTLPECETMHIHGERHVMEQRFPNGAVIVVDFSDGSGVLRDSKGVERLRKEGMAIRDLEVMQGVAVGL